MSRYWIIPNRTLYHLNILQAASAGDLVCKMCLFQPGCSDHLLVLDSMLFPVTHTHTHQYTQYTYKHVNSVNLLFLVALAQ